MSESLSELREEIGVLRTLLANEKREHEATTRAFRRVTEENAQLADRCRELRLSLSLSACVSDRAMDGETIKNISPMAPKSNTSD